MCPACQECKADTGVCGALNDSQTDPRCTDTDGTQCTKPGCEAGACVQGHIPPPTCPACQGCKADTGACRALHDSPTHPGCTATAGPPPSNPGSQAGLGVARRS